MKTLLSKLLILFLLLTNAIQAREFYQSKQVIKPFSTDGCSMVPDGRFKSKLGNEWRHCCIIHDFAYWMGGSRLRKSLADKKLSSCVDKLDNSEKFISNQGQIMYLGASIGGLPKFLMINNPTGFRWGYGFKNLHGFYPLLEEQLSTVNTELEVFKTKLEGQTSRELKMTELQVDQIIFAIEQIQRDL